MDLNGEPLEPGDEVEYQLDFDQLGTEALPSLQVTDVLDSGLVYLDDSLLVDGALPYLGPFPLEAGVTVPEGLAPGAQSRWSSVRIVEEAEQGQVITNQATLADDGVAAQRRPESARITAADGAAGRQRRRSRCVQACPPR